MIEALPKIFKDLGYAKNFDENGELEKYLINKNFFLSGYMGYETAFSPTFNTLENLVNKKTNFYIQLNNIRLPFDINQKEVYISKANYIQTITLFKGNKVIFKENIQCSFYIDNIIVLEVDGQENREFLKITLKPKFDIQPLFSIKILKELLN